MVKTGLDILWGEGFSALRGKRFGVLCHQASVNGKGEHILDLMAREGVLPEIIFAPEHGLFPVAQDQEIVAHWRHPRYGVPIVSLYGADWDSLYPPGEIMQDLELLVVDLFDVGARYYTFIWTAAMALEVAAKTKTRVLVLDRPNPIRGDLVEGPVQEEGFYSFVGLYPLPIRHGLTVGEVFLYVNEFHGIGADVSVVKLSGWRRDMWFDETGLLWVMPSPNMPSLDTAVVYPGMCLLEGTNVSEGRGTTRPFEIFGVPFADPWKLADFLNEIALDGVFFRPMYFVPTFNKYAGQVCGGVQIHVVDRDVFEPVLAGIAVLTAFLRLWPRKFEFRNPPYEFEREKLPIDILLGSDRWRRMIISGAPLDEIAGAMRESASSFAEIVEPFKLY